MKKEREREKEKEDREEKKRDRKRQRQKGGKRTCLNLKERGEHFKTSIREVRRDG